MEAIPLPHKPTIEELGDHKYQLILEPLYPGYGVTIGNALRRVLLSSLPGAAVTSVKIKFADHEFSTVPHIKEDVIQIILNLKQLRLKSYSASPVKISLKAKGERVVTAADIKVTDQVEVLNPDLYIATIDNKNGELDLELTVEQGRGYVPVEARENEKHEVGELAVDAIYTPVKSVYFDITHVRVGQMTNFDKLVMHVETNGTITGQEALDIASRIIVDHFNLMFGFETKPAELDTSEAGEETTVEGEALTTELEVASDLDTVNLSNRAKNALVKNGIVTMEALNALTNEEIENIAGLGKKTIAEIITLLGREQ